MAACTMSASGAATSTGVVARTAAGSALLQSTERHAGGGCSGSARTGVRSVLCAASPSRRSLSVVSCGIWGGCCAARGSSRRSSLSSGGGARGERGGGGGKGSESSVSRRGACYSYGRRIARVRVYGLPPASAGSFLCGSSTLTAENSKDATWLRDALVACPRAAWGEESRWRTRASASSDALSETSLSASDRVILAQSAVTLKSRESEGGALVGGEALQGALKGSRLDVGSRVGVRRPGEGLASAPVSRVIIRAAGAEERERSVNGEEGRDGGAPSRPRLRLRNPSEADARVGADSGAGAAAVRRPLKIDRSSLGISRPGTGNRINPPQRSSGAAVDGRRVEKVEGGTAEGRGVHRVGGLGAPDRANGAREARVVERPRPRPVDRPVRLDRPTARSPVRTREEEGLRQAGSGGNVRLGGRFGEAQGGGARGLEGGSADRPRRVLPRGGMVDTRRVVESAASAPPPSGGVSRKAPAKGREDWRKKNEGEGPRRRSLVATRGAKNDEDVDLEMEEEVGEGVIPDLGGLLGQKRKGGGKRKRTKADKARQRAEAAKAAAPVRVEILEVGKEGMAVADLAHHLAVNDSEVVKTLFLKGVMSMVNQVLDEETVKMVCQEYGVEIITADEVSVGDLAKKRADFNIDDEGGDLVDRPPVVTIMGHVDHGKAFSAMRARGARVTDIAIIVVAADDGVRPQTLEAIAHAKAANVPIVIAINKVDKDDANPDRVRQELSGHGLMPEEWGGDVPMVPVSAWTGEGVELLLETVVIVAETSLLDFIRKTKVAAGEAGGITQSIGAYRVSVEVDGNAQTCVFLDTPGHELQELKANPNRKAKGTVIEASLDKSKGALATLLVQTGTVKKGDVLLCSEVFGKVLGLNDVPVAGDEFEVVESEKEARERAELRALSARQERLAALAGEGKVTLASFAASVAGAAQSGDTQERQQLNVVLRVDAQGSVEAIREALSVLPQEAVGLRFLMQAAGDVNGSDVDLAAVSDAIIIAFNVGFQPGVEVLAESKGVEIRQYKVIYELVDDMRRAMEGLLDPIEVAMGLECGVGVEDFNEWVDGDIIEAYNLIKKAQTLEGAAKVTTAAAAAVAAAAASNGGANSTSASSVGTKDGSA
ncbi:hypothetical protein CBR_g39246 [Chara braunii]|uniref:Tr-type G domain-containing protein n=1 Tax=Chara braunii TaxID=69332 RepID=A0A388LRH2_CHABU|nr:hypothetical protein CBR_g39246 [Chara braunii]|eukprot:GBG84871.1 hypothetical protein CBR_g39246 [Chara braunii]